MGIGIFRQRRKYRALGSPSGEAQAAGTAQEFTATEPARDGFREFLVKRRVIEDDARSVCSFYLVPADGQPLPAFKPGQFLTFSFSLRTRCAMSPGPWCAAIHCRTVRILTTTGCPSSGHSLQPGRRMSRPGFPPIISTTRCRKAHGCLVKAPSGHFHLMTDEPLPIVLVGGGIGITPMLSILNTVFVQRNLKGGLVVLRGV